MSVKAIAFVAAVAIVGLTPVLATSQRLCQSVVRDLTLNEMTPGMFFGEDVK